MLTPEQIQQKTEACTAPRVTEAMIRDRVTDVTFTRLNETVTICNIQLDNGYSVRGESACVDPANYNEDLGKHYAEADARKKLWPLFGFLLAEQLWINRVLSAEKQTGEQQSEAA